MKIPKPYAQTPKKSEAPISNLPAFQFVCQLQSLLVLGIWGFIGVWSLGFGVSAAHAADPPPVGKTVSLFDGKTLDGWEGNLKWWRLEDDVITGGSLTQNVPNNEFLCTKKSYGNFILRLKFKLRGAGGFINSGVQIRSQRIPNHHEVSGYQCDIGDPTWWGAIYDESRRNRVLAQSDMKALEPKLRRDDWNEYVIRADGPRLTLWINGIQTCDYTETDPKIADTGIIGVQVHGGGKALAQFKDITIEELPPTVKFEGAPPPSKPPKASPLTPDEQKQSFSLPPGFEIELFASEEHGVIKPITVAWDAAGRLWTMTATEYPVDSNEQSERSKQLFAQGGKDRVLIFDKPYDASARAPRVFADGLAIPLGLLPYRAGTFAQYGNDILFLRDTNGDGKADSRESVLTGFGTQDSHLFPHQFTRGPGGWIYMAQGAFNSGNVRDKDGKTTKFAYCKMGRFRPDGSNFEIVGWGLNNIWGFVIGREGEMFIQEANDLGFPVTPFFVGASYPGIGNDRAKPYAPFQPALGAHFQMGGTGLSGLALSDDRNNWPVPYADVMYVSNPITSRINAIKIHPDGTGYRLEKLPDLVACSDPWFRPIAIHFGPDGSLYIVDWYNKVISHNEVPRNHPDRDKSHGRIWRVRHKNQPPRTVPDLTRVADADLLKHLAADNTWEATTAWQQIVDRKAEKLTPQLSKIAADAKLPTDVRIRALWALEGLGKADSALLQTLTRDPNRNLRRETVRTVSSRQTDGGQASKSNSTLLQLLEPLASDPDSQIRAEVIRSLGGIKDASGRHTKLLVEMADEPLDGAPVTSGTNAGPSAAHDRAFERYLIRAALENDPKQTEEFFNWSYAGNMPVENRLLASLALEPKTSASRVAKLLPQLKRPPNDEELLRLVEFLDEPGVGDAVKAVLKNPAQSAVVLESLLRIRNRLDTAKLTPLLTDAARSLWTGDAVAKQLAVRLASAFKLTVLESDLVALLQKTSPKDQQLSALRALREMNSGQADLFAKLAQSADADLRQEAILALASSTHERAPVLLLEFVGKMNPRERRDALDRLASTPRGAQGLVKAFAANTLPITDLDGALADKLQAVLGKDAELVALLEANAALFRNVLRLDGKDDSFADTNITLAGAFTVEAWVRFAPGIGNDDGILCASGVADFNFYDSKFRLWAGPALHDVIIAKKKIVPDTWTHVAITRDAPGKFKLYLNGELDTDECKPDTTTYANLDVGFTAASPGTTGDIMEFRVWNVARSPEEIRASFDRSFDGETQPDSLVKYYSSGAPRGKLKGGAKLVRTSDFPPLLTGAEAKEMEAKLAKYRTLAEKAGDTSASLSASVARGKELFAKTCLVCHKVGNEGAGFAPALDGSGHRDPDALLRALLTPSAAIEGGYRMFRVEMKDGDVKDGFLVSQDTDAIVLRAINSEPERIAQKDIRAAGFTKRSIMPDGLLEAMSDEQVRDLFTFVKTLK